MRDQISRRTLLGGGIGVLGAAAAGPLAQATEHPTVSAAPDAACWATPLAQDYTVVIQKSAADLRKLDGPGLVKLPDGTLVAVVTVEPRGASTVVQVAESSDGGQDWTLTARLPYNAAVPWEHEGVLYVFAHPKGTGGYREDDLLLLRSDDAGKTWSEPVTLFEGHFWNVQTGMAVREGQLYWSADDYVATARRGPRVVAGDLSADLMNPKSWRISNHVQFPGLPESLLNPRLTGRYPSQRMLEPNVLNVGGQLRVLAAVKPPLQATTNLAAVFDVSDDGENIELSFTQFHPMPGGQVKFCILWDEVSELFWATVNLAVDGQDQFGFEDPAERRGSGAYSGAIGGNDRRFLMLMYGLDGLNWFPAGCVARAGRLAHSFMYPSHIIDGNDLLVIARSSVNGQNRHDADCATLHRVRNFRSLAMNLRQDIDEP